MQWYFAWGRRMQLPEQYTRDSKFFVQVRLDWCTAGRVSSQPDRTALAKTQGGGCLEVLQASVTRLKTTLLACWDHTEAYSATVLNLPLVNPWLWTGESEDDWGSLCLNLQLPMQTAFGSCDRQVYRSFALYIIWCDPHRDSTCSSLVRAYKVRISSVDKLSQCHAVLLSFWTTAVMLVLLMSQYCDIFQTSLCCTFVYTIWKKCFQVNWF